MRLAHAVDGKLSSSCGDPKQMDSANDFIEFGTELSSTGLRLRGKLFNQHAAMHLGFRKDTHLKEMVKSSPG
jgi:hypothetical protein